MPENTPPERDPFADLYGRLPDPRRGASAGDAPPSRRAAREARAAADGAPGTTDGTRSDDTRSDAPRPDAPRRSPGDTPSAPAVATPASGATPDPAAGRPAVGIPPQNTPRAAAGSDPSRGAGSPDVPARPLDTAPAAEARRPASRATGGHHAAPGPRRSSTTSRDGEPAREPALVGAGAASAAVASAPGPTASGSLEQLFSGETTTHDIGQPAPQPSRTRRHLGRWIALAVVVLLIGGIIGGGMALWNTYGDRVQAFLGQEEPADFEPGQATGEARVTIVAGDTGESVSPKLFEAGITKASNSLYSYMIDNSIAFTFQPGVYKLQQQMTSEAVLAALRVPENRLDYAVQLREGLTLAQSLDVISEQLGMARSDLDAAVADPSQYGVSASTLEGWIFPATYDFDEGVTPTQVIDTMVARTMQSLDAAGVPEADRERVLIIASIIEREARSSEDFYKVSRVIENRLQPSNQETFGKLEMDSTVQYGAGEMGSGSVSTSEEARNSDNPWNTYMYPGLPIGPIANAGDLAIDAAMKPADGPWLYFVTVNLDTGETVFTSTYAEHLAAVEQWRAWCSENPDSGC